MTRRTTFELAERSEYDVVALRISPGLASVFCLLVSFILTSMARYAHWLWVKGYGPWVELGRWTAIGAAVLGMVLGAVTIRRGERSLGLLGLLGNGIVLVLLGLFLFLFDWILRR